MQAGLLFKHCAFERKDQPVATPLQKEKTKLTRTVFRSTPTRDIDHVFRVDDFILVIIVAVIIIVIIV